MHPYETLFVLRADLPEAQIRETIDRARRLIESMAGTMGSVDEWGVRDLAYPIGKEKRGYYILIEYSAKPDVVLEFERTLKLADEVLRFITVRQSEKASKVESKPRSSAPEPEGESSEGEDEDQVGAES